MGFIEISNGSIVTAKLNFIVNVDDGTIPAVTITATAAGVQTSRHLVNMLLAGADPATIDLRKVGASFYAYNSDSFDFLGVITTPTLIDNRHYVAISNAVSGLGLPAFNNSRRYGSAGRLKGFGVFPVPAFFDLAETGALHELGHSAMVYLAAPALRGVKTHWPISTLARGLMGFNIPGGNVGGHFDFQVVPTSDGRYRLDTAQPQQDFSDLELYLLGFAPPSEVGPHLVFNNQNQAICGGCILDGPVTTLTRCRRHSSRWAAATSLPGGPAKLPLRFDRCQHCPPHDASRDGRL